MATIRLNLQDEKKVSHIKEIIKKIIQRCSKCFYT